MLTCLKAGVSPIDRSVFEHEGSEYSVPTKQSQLYSLITSSSVGPCSTSSALVSESSAVRTFAHHHSSDALDAF